MNSYITLINTVIDVVKMIEFLMPSSTGKDKLDAALVMIEKLLGPLTELLPKITAMISLAVSVFNASGLFKKN